MSTEAARRQERLRVVYKHYGRCIQCNGGQEWCAELEQILQELDLR